MELDDLYSGLSVRGLSPRTVRICHTVVRQPLEQARRWGLIARSPAVDATPPRQVRTEVAPPTVDQVRQLIDAARDDDPEFGTYLRLLAATGAGAGRPEPFAGATSISSQVSSASAARSPPSTAVPSTTTSTVAGAWRSRASQGLGTSAGASWRRRPGCGGRSLGASGRTRTARCGERFPPQIAAWAKRVHRSRREADRAVARAQHELGQGVRELARLGLSRRDSAAVLGLSHH
jgi:hypothetical protein